MVGCRHRPKAQRQPSKVTAEMCITSLWMILFISYGLALSLKSSNNVTIDMGARGACASCVVVRDGTSATLPTQKHALANVGHPTLQMHTLVLTQLTMVFG